MVALCGLPPNFGNVLGPISGAFWIDLFPLQTIADSVRLERSVGLELDY